MEEKCFNCAGPASERYTLILESGKILEDKVICEECVSDFRDVEWMEVVHESSVLKRGGDDG